MFMLSIKKLKYDLADHNKSKDVYLRKLLTLIARIIINVNNCIE